MALTPVDRRTSRGAFVVAAVALVGFAVLAARVGARPDAAGWELTAQRHLLGVHRRGLRDLARVGAGASAPGLLVAVAVVGALVLWRPGHRPALAGALLAVPLATAGLVQLLTSAFAGARPALGHVLGLTVLGGSFPSAPAADATALWGLLALALAASARRPRTWLVCALGWLVLGGSVVWDQLVEGRWLDDVLAGVLLGLAAVAGCGGVLAGWARAPGSGRRDPPARTLDR